MQGWPNTQRVARHSSSIDEIVETQYKIQCTVHERRECLDAHHALGRWLKWVSATTEQLCSSSHGGCHRYQTPATITDCSKIVKVRASSILAGFLLKLLYVIRTTPHLQVGSLVCLQKFGVLTRFASTLALDAPWPPSPPPPLSLTARAIFWAALLRLSRSKSSTARRLSSFGARRSTFPAVSSATRCVLS